MQVVVDSLLTTFSEVGKGKKIVLLLHGWADSAATFETLAAELKQDFTILSLDLPGFGGTQAPPSAWGLDDYAHFVAQFLKKIHKQPTAIVGHSNGGAIAIKGLANGELTARRLVLIASAGVRKTNAQALHRLGWGAIAKVGKAATIVLPKGARATLRRRLYGAAGSDMLIAEHMQKTFKRVVNEDVLAQATQVTAPALLIYGDQDTSTPSAYAQAFAKALPNATIEIIPGADHFVHQQKSSLVAQKVKEFLR